MKKQIGVDFGAYSFDPSSKQIGITGAPLLQPEQIMLVVNATRGVFLYNPADSAYGGTFANNVLTVSASTSGHAATDDLIVLVNMPDALAAKETVDDPTSRAFSPADRDSPELSRDLQQTYDVVLDRALALLSDQTGINVHSDFRWRKANGVAQAAGQIVGMDVRGMSSAVVSLSGTWAGTQTFEALTEDGVWTAILGRNLNSTALPSSTTTSGGNFRFNTAGVQQIRVRFSTYTSGKVEVTLVASAVPFSDVPSVSAYGSQGQVLVQRATTYEQTTYDTNLATVLGTAKTTIQPTDTGLSTQAPATPTLQGTTLTRWQAMQPQIYPMVNTWVNGSQRVPLAQEPYTNRLLVSSPDIIQYLELIFLELKQLNALMLENAQKQPSNLGWTEQ